MQRMWEERPDHVDRPHPSRLAAGHPHFVSIMAHHQSAVDAALPSYRDPLSGYAVFTSVFLASRAYCCESGCRHCPYVGSAGTDHVC